MSPTLTLIIVTHNSARWLPRFFKTWQDAVTTLPHEIFIADSGSSDKTCELACSLAPSAKILHCGNVGFGAAANRAAALSSGPWILLCNPDLTFPTNFESDFLAPLTTHPPAGTACIAPALSNEDQSPQHSVGKFPTLCGMIRDQFRPGSERKYILNPQNNLCDWATGACLLIRREHWNAVAGFDEKFFLYVEEVDFQRRLASLGLRTFLQRDVAVTHLSPAASRSPSAAIRRYAARGLLRYFAKHGTRAQLFAYRLLALAAARLSPKEALAPKQKILQTPTGP